MIHALRAHHAVWANVMENVALTIGRRTPLYSAARRARLGKDPGGERFAALAARLPAKDRGRILQTIEELDSERAKASWAA